MIIIYLYDLSGNMKGTEEEKETEKGRGKYSYFQYHYVDCIHINFSNIQSACLIIENTN